MIREPLPTISQRQPTMQGIIDTPKRASLAALLLRSILHPPGSADQDTADLHLIKRRLITKRERSRFTFIESNRGSLIQRFNRTL